MDQIDALKSAVQRLVALLVDPEYGLATWNLAVQETVREIASFSSDGAKLRKLLWLRHGCPSSALYGDDGEMQCHACGIDFKRMPADQIQASFERRGLEELARLGIVPERAEDRNTPFHKRIVTSVPIPNTRSGRICTLECGHMVQMFGDISKANSVSLCTACKYVSDHGIFRKYCDCRGSRFQRISGNQVVCDVCSLPINPEGASR